MPNIEHGHIYFVKMLCRVVCRGGDIKHLEDLVLSASSVSGRASVEEEVVIPEHCGTLEGDGGRVNCTVPEVR
jgi:hypothetical protein